MHRLRTLVVGGLVAGMAACTGAADLKDGKQVYDKICVTCHGPKGTPDATMAAKLGVKDLRAPELRTRITVDLVENQVKRGSKNKLMPAFEGALDDVQIRAVADYVSSKTFLER
jgi:mono/diheme cytochrome c family protein